MMMPIFALYPGTASRAYGIDRILLTTTGNVTGSATNISYLTMEDAQRLVIEYARLVQQIGALKSEQLAPNLKRYMDNVAAADSGGE
jgi:hypothetical protein